MRSVVCTDRVRMHTVQTQMVQSIAGTWTYFALIENWYPIEREEEEEKQKHVLSPSWIFPAFPLLNLCTAIERRGIDHTYHGKALRTTYIPPISPHCRHEPDRVWYTGIGFAIKRVSIDIEIIVITRTRQSRFPRMHIAHAYFGELGKGLQV